MKKLIFILIAMVSIVACSSDRDNNKPDNQEKLNPKFYSKIYASQLYIFGKEYVNSPNFYDIKVSTSSENDVYVIVDKNNVATLKIFDDTYTGTVTNGGAYYFIFSDYKSGKKISVQGFSDIQIGEITEVNIKSTNKKYTVSTNTGSLKMIY